MDKWVEDDDNLRTIIYISCYMFLLTMIGIASTVRNVRNQRYSQEILPMSESIHKSNPSESDMFSLTIPEDKGVSTDIIIGMTSTLDDNNSNNNELVEAAGELTSGMRHESTALTSQKHNDSMDFGSSSLSPIGGTKVTHSPSSATFMSLLSISGDVTPTNEYNSGLTKNNNVSDLCKDKNKRKQTEADVDSMATDGNKQKQGLTCHDFCDAFGRKSFYSKCGHDIMVGRGIYGTVLVYAFDIVTDINVMILWFNRGFGSGKDNIEGVQQLAVLSCIIIGLYKIISAYSVFDSISKHLSVCKRLQYGVLQFLDVYLFFEVFQSIQIGKKTQKLRWINSMEAALESAPQIILQTVYLLLYEDVESVSTNSLVTLGLCFSISKLGTTAIGADKLSVKKDAKSPFSSFKYTVRFLFRIFEITSRVLVYVLIWVALGGEYLAIIAGIHFVHNLILFCGGCLGREIFNIFGFILYIPRLNRTLQEGEQKFECLQNNVYIKFYRKSGLTRMILIRSLELFIYCVGLFINYYFIENGSSRSGDIIILSSNDTDREKLFKVMYAIAVIFIVLTPLFWVWILGADIIDWNNRHEQKALADIYAAIKLDRLDNIKEHFNNEKDVTLIRDGTRINSDTNTTPLHLACRLDCAAIAFWMVVESGFVDETHINALDVHDQTPLYLACKFGALETIKALFKKETIRKLINVSKANKNNQNCVYAACKYNHYGVLNYLLFKCDSGVKEVFVSLVNQQTTTRGLTPLHIASKEGYFECVKLLLDLDNTDINVLTFGAGEAAIHLSVLNKHKSIANSLINDSRFTLTKQGYKKLWYYCIESDNREIAQKLLEMKNLGLDVLTPVTIDFDNGDDSEKKEAAEESAMERVDDTPLWIACRNNASEIVRMILNIDDSVINICDSRKNSPLYMACKFGYAETAIALLENSKTDLLFKKKPEKNTLLMAACEGGSTIIFNSLTNRIEEKYGFKRLKKELTRGNDNDETPLWIACRYDSYQIVSILTTVYDKYVDLNKPCKDGRTPLSVAEHFGNRQSIQQVNLYSGWSEGV